MKAAVYRHYGSPDVVNIETINTPIPAENEILIRIHASTVSTEDSIFRRGSPLVSRLATGLITPKKPVLGSYLSGVVTELGNQVTQFQPGEEVIAVSDEHFAAHAEYICLDENSVITRKPPNCSFDQAVCICAGAITALPFLRDIGRLHNGQKVLIIGAAGSIGSAAVQIARYLGAKVTGVCSGANLQLVRSLGAIDSIDYTSTDVTRMDHKFDLIFDTVGKSRFSDCQRILNKGGMYLTTVLGFNILFSMLSSRVIGDHKAAIHFAGLRPNSGKKDDLDFLVQLYRNGHLKPVIDRVYSLSQITRAHAFVDLGHKTGNVVIQP